MNAIILCVGYAPYCSGQYRCRAGAPSAPIRPGYCAPAAGPLLALGAQSVARQEQVDE
ncbi:hypothetical protein [Nocardia asiatica]|uniref:hypothetical protein n=1 Tax=Nocardia asiatica TaxID=209252 RepID=UPI003EE0F348